MSSSRRGSVVSDVRRGSVVSGRRQSVFEVGGDLKPAVVEEEIDRDEIVRTLLSKEEKRKLER